MESFGYFSSLLNPVSKWSHWLKWLPDEFRYRYGPLKAGEIRGVLPRDIILGWGWKVPKNPVSTWSKPQTNQLWHQLEGEIKQKEIKTIGIDPFSPFLPPIHQLKQPSFPGISDGKTLELLIFLNHFRKLLHNYELPASKAKVAIVWEEGNLGLTCARLIAGDIRFLTLVHPNYYKVEQAAEMILAESGVSPRIMTKLDPEFKEVRIIIRCGKLTQYNLISQNPRLIKCDLFKSYPTLISLNQKIPLEFNTKSGKIPLYPALGETIIRAISSLHKGVWYGSELPLERVLKLSKALAEIGIKNLF